MKATLNSKRYDTDNCEEIGRYEHHSHGNNYSGTTYLLRASNGTMIVYRNTNGQDLYLADMIAVWSKADYPIDDFAMSDKQEARAVELGLIEIIK